MREKRAVSSKKEKTQSEWERERERARKENEGHLKWTVLPNWEMKSDDAMGDDNQGRERKREYETKKKRNVVYTIGDDEKTTTEKKKKRCCVCWSNLHMRIRCVGGCVEMCRETCTYAFQLVDRETSWKIRFFFGATSEWKKKSKQRKKGFTSSG